MTICKVCETEFENEHIRDLRNIVLVTVVSLLNFIMLLKIDF